MSYLGHGFENCLYFYTKVKKFQINWPTNTIYVFRWYRQVVLLTENYCEYVRGYVYMCDFGEF